MIYNFTSIQKEREKQEKQAAFHAKLEKGEVHHERKLLRKYGFEPLKQLLNESRQNFQIAETHHNNVLMRMIFEEWLVYTRRLTEEKQRKANELYERILVRRSFASWKKVKFYQITFGFSF